jgi:hypothetical protein
MLALEVLEQRRRADADLRSDLAQTDAAIPGAREQRFGHPQHLLAARLRSARRHRPRLGHDRRVANTC